jgi:hypothetical protein
MISNITVQPPNRNPDGSLKSMTMTPEQAGLTGGTNIFGRYIAPAADFVPAPASLAATPKTVNQGSSFILAPEVLNKMWK